MRGLIRKIHCPSFICFCKPSPTICTAGPLKLEDSPHAPSTATISVANASANDRVSRDSVEVKEESVDVDGKQSLSQDSRKSCLKKVALPSKEADKKKVQWIDSLGKELVEIREFEPSELEDTDSEDESNRGCTCTIL